ncbi:GNAT family N-acetyltransferase [Saccharopolyspora hirsuta]|uniref:GNAT family N-acetyltransferase n=1 Tax=Saccharopolyspora hirsuta TaxID=1837 RepID=A0A5M7C3H6_SACHI|nr:GNAT family N-acetyltransferase [Saccharopolyspora hirsuta]
MVLSRLRPADADAFIAVHSAPEAYPHDGWSRRTPEQARELFDRFLRDWATNGIGYWTIRLAGTGEVIGFGGVRHAEEDGEPVLNLAYRLWPSAWGNGYAPEMAETALCWAKRHRTERPVVIVTDTGNAPSVRVAEKLGFALHQERRRDGRPELVFRST